jgi:hypothetical protein
MDDTEKKIFMFLKKTSDEGHNS